MTDLRYTALMIFTLLMSFTCLAQQTDSNATSVRQEALEMRNKLNQYMNKQLDAKIDPTLRLSLSVDSMKQQLSVQQQEIEKLKQMIAELKDQKASASPANTGTVNRTGKDMLTLYFETDKDELNMLQKEAIVSFLREKTGSRFAVKGYTDASGSESHNRLLRKSRCSAVARIVRMEPVRFKSVTNAKCTAEPGALCRKVELVAY